MREPRNRQEAWKAALELATAYIDEHSRGDTKRALSRQILSEYMPEPLPENFHSIATLTAGLLGLLDVSVRSQAVGASIARGSTVSVEDILASLGQAIEGGT
jgi:hypothetical protein